VSRDVIFEEEIAFQRFREYQMEIDSETIPSQPSVVQRETTIIPVDPVVPVDLVATVDIPIDIAVGHKRHARARKTLGHASPQGTFRKNKRPRRFSSYFSAMSHIIDTKPSCHEEAAGRQVWKDAMTKEYQSILKNDVWDIVLRPEGKFVVTSKWIYKIKHAVDGSVEKYTVDILKRFEIIDCGSMPTPMMMNLKKMKQGFF
jgi:hypothetical protein